MRLLIVEDEIVLCKSIAKGFRLSGYEVDQANDGASYPFIAPDKSNFNGRLDGLAGLPFTFFVNSKGDVVGDSYSGARSYDDWKAIVDKELAKVN